MEIFIDTAKLSEINEARSWGIVDRVTTNPTLLRVRKITAEKLNRCLRNSATNEISSLYLDVRKINDALENDGIGSEAELVKKIVEILRNYDMKTKVIAASMRNPRQVREVAEAGADIGTIHSMCSKRCSGTQRLREVSRNSTLMRLK